MIEFVCRVAVEIYMHRHVNKLRHNFVLVRLEFIEEEKEKKKKAEFERLHQSGKSQIFFFFLQLGIGLLQGPILQFFRETLN